MVELISKRKWDSKTFDTGRVDEKEHTIYGTTLQNGLHDVELDGSFVECNPSMLDYDGNVSTLEAVRGRYGHLRAGDTGSESKDRIKILTKKDCGISLKLCGHKTYGPWDDTTRKIRFDTNDGITLNYYPSYKGVNIVVTVDNPQITSNIITFSLKAYGCDYIYEEKDGNIIAKSSTGEDDIYINALYAIDANGDSEQVSFRLSNIVDGYQRIEKVINPIWFGNAAGPVELDPSVTIDDVSGTLEDNLLISATAQAGYNYGGLDSLQARNRSALDWFVSLLKVDLSAYTGNTVTLAYFGLDIFGGLATQDIAWNRVLIPWGEGNQTGSTAAAGTSSWNTSESPTTWNTAGCQGDGTDRQAIPEGTASISSIPDSDYHLGMTLATVQAWLDDASNNNGILLDAPDIQAGSKWINVRSSEATSGNKPYFYMEWVDGEGGFPFFFDIGH